VLAEADELVVLADDLGGAFGEVEGEGGLVGAEVVDVEDEFLGEVFGGAPDDPAYTWVDESIPVPISIVSIYCLRENGGLHDSGTQRASEASSTNEKRLEVFSESTGWRSACPLGITAVEAFLLSRNRRNGKDTYL
jgi:hypothetical protein